MRGVWDSLRLRECKRRVWDRLRLRLRECKRRVWVWGEGICISPKTFEHV